MGKADTFNTIVVSNDPRGRMAEGIIDGTPKPGTVMQLKSAVEPVNGRFTWEVFNRDADGNRPKGPFAVLMEDHLQGRTIDDAFVSGSRGQLYFPLPGDELLMRLQDVAGTGDTRAIGDMYIVDDGTGTLIATTGTPETEPFMLLETLAAPTADTLAHVMFSGF